MVDRPGLIWWVLVIGGLGLTFALAVSADAYAWMSATVPGFSAVLPRAVVQWIALAAALVHVAEGLYAYFLARRIGASASATEWAGQTLLLGFPSLRLLLARARVARGKG